MDNDSPANTSNRGLHNQPRNAMLALQSAMRAPPPLVPERIHRQIDNHNANNGPIPAQYAPPIPFDVQAYFRRTRARRCLTTAIRGPTVTLLATGSTARIYSVPGTNTIVKEALHPGVDAEDEGAYSLLEETMIHRLVHSAFAFVEFTGVHVPRHLTYHSDDIIERHENERDAMVFPFAYQGRSLGPLSVYERVPDVPAYLCTAVVEAFGEGGDMDGLGLGPREGQQCHFLVMMGKSRNGANDVQRTSMHGYELCLDQFEQLDVDVYVIVRQMGYALAIMHWTAGIDAKGIKFILGGPPTEEHYVDGMEKRDQGINRGNRALHLWTIGFNKSAVIPSTEEFVRLAALGFLQNKEFWPRPQTAPGANHRDIGLWFEFRNSYMRASDTLEGDHTGLALRFLLVVEEYFGYDSDDEDNEDEDDNENENEANADVNSVAL